MIHKIEEIIFTDKTKDGKELINKGGNKFFMLHIRVKDMGQDKWISKYYSEDKSEKIKGLLKEGVEYDFFYKHNPPYFNLISIHESIIDNGTGNKIKGEQLI